MLLGFSTGSLYENHGRLSPATFDIFRKIGANAIEIMWYEDTNDIVELLAIEKSDLVGFEYISIHTPSFENFSDGEITAMLQALAKVHEKIKFNAVVLHPYETMNWDLFRQFDLPFMIENMDWRKNFGKFTESMKNIFESFDVPMVLNVNHCFTNDPSMRLAYEMIDAFGDRIKEVHLSGFESCHEPIFKTQQREILEAIPDKNIPIIIESTCQTIKDVKKEFEYVKSFFGE